MGFKFNMKILLTKTAFRPFIYATIITIGFIILLGMLNEGLTDYYWIGSLFLFLIVLVELYFTANHYHVYHRRSTRKKYDFEHHKLIQYSHHIVLPSLYFLALTLFNFYNDQPSLIFLNLAMVFFSFFILFENVHSFYKHKFSLHKSTTYIYDLLGVLLVFLLVFDAFELIRNQKIEDSIFIVLAFIFVFGLNVLLLTVRNSITKREILFGIVFTLAMTLLGQLTIFGDASAISIAFLSGLIFRSYTIFINYTVEHIISKEELFEDLVMLILVAALLNIYIG